MVQKLICSPEGTLNHHKTKCKECFPEMQRVYFHNLPSLTGKNLTRITVVSILFSWAGAPPFQQPSICESLRFHHKTHKSQWIIKNQLCLALLCYPDLTSCHSSFSVTPDTTRQAALGRDFKHSLWLLPLTIAELFGISGHLPTSTSTLNLFQTADHGHPSP